MKAFCLAFVFVLLIAPAAAGELASSRDGAQEFGGRLYHLEWPPQGTADEDDAAAPADSSGPAAAQFAAQVRAMLALAKDEVRRTAASSDPVRLDIRLRCMAKRVVTRSPAHQPFVPALEWSAEWPATEPTQTVTTKVVKACAIKLVRRQPAAPAQEARMQPYSVELPVIEEAAR